MPDAASNPIWSRDARDIETTRTFDALNRPLREETDDGGGAKLRRMWTYIAYDEGDPDHSSTQSKNLYGQLEESRDADGLRFFEYDWRGLVLKASHRFWPQLDGTKTWDDATNALWTSGSAWDEAIDDTARASITDWLELVDLTDTTTLEIETRYDAAGRPLQTEYPEGMRLTRSYNAAGLPETLSVRRTSGGGEDDLVLDEFGGVP